MRFFHLLRRYSLFFHFLTIFIVLFGIFILLKMQREARPNVNMNKVIVSTFYPGASPSDVEELVIDPIEEEIAEIDGVEEYQSISASGTGSVYISIDDEYLEPQEVVDEIRRQVTQIKSLPESVENPTVTEIKAKNIPILKVALYGDLSSLQMKEEAEKLKSFFKTFPGVQSVSYVGVSDLQFKILTHPEKLNENDITLMELIYSLSEWTKKRPGGLLEGQGETVHLKVGSEYKNIGSLKDFVIRSNDSNKKVKLSQLASIFMDTEDIQRSQFFENKSAVLLTVVKKPFFDIIKTVESLKKGLKDHSKNLSPSLKYKIYSDESRRIQETLRTVTINAIFGLCFVLLILILLLDFRSAVVASLGIPIAILGGFILIFYLGNTINALCVLGLTIVLGMLIDDAVVVCENIYFHLQSGLKPWEAAIKGVGEMARPVTATVLTTIFSFFPIVFMKGIMGQFLKVIPITVIALLLISLFEALFILPVHAAEMMRVKKRDQKKKHFFLSKIEALYKRYLSLSLKHPKFIVLLLLVFFVFSVFQGSHLFKKFTLFPAKGLRGVSIRLELKANSSLQDTEKHVKDLSSQLLEGYRDVFEAVYADVGTVQIGGSSFGSRKNLPHLAMIRIRFTADPSFFRKEKQILADIQQRVKSFSEKTGVFTSLTLFRPGPPIGKPIQIQVTSRDKKIRQQAVKNIMEELSQIKGVHSLETDSDKGYKRNRILIDNQLAVSEGVQLRDISSTVFSATTGSVVNELLVDNEKVELLVGLFKDKEFRSEDILDLKLRNKRGQAMPLHSFASVKGELALPSIQRWNGLKVTTLLGEVDEKIISGKEVVEKIKPKIEELRRAHPTLRIELEGAEKERQKALTDLIPLYFFALLMIFMVISLSFHSFLYPFLVLMAIPMGLGGMVWALTFHGQVLSLMSLIGAVGLSGVVVNNSIILLATFQEKIKRGEDVKKALISSSLRRLRPIVITSLTTLIGLLPTIYGLGGGIDFLTQPVALVIGWGLFASTCLILLTLPSILFLVFKNSEGRQSVGR